MLTYNIHKGFNASNRRFVLHQIKHLLLDISPDIVFLQEIQGEHTEKSGLHHDWPDDSQFEFLADQVWPHHAYGKNAIYKAGHHGNAILSKFPFVRWENINVSYMQSASRSLLHGVVRLHEHKGMPLHVVCVHLGLLQMERKRQLATLVDRINEHVPAHEPLIIAGDFNDWNRRSSQYLWENLHVSEVFKSGSGKYARTFPAWLPLLTVDRIYSRGLMVKDNHRLHGRQWQGLSDHLPLLAEFTLI